MSSHMTSFAPKYDDTYARLKDETYARLRCACRHISVQKRHIWWHVRLAQVYASSHFGAKTSYMTTCTQGSGVTCRVISVQKRHNNDMTTRTQGSGVTCRHISVQKRHIWRQVRKAQVYESSYLYDMFAPKYDGTYHLSLASLKYDDTDTWAFLRFCAEIWRHVTPEGFANMSSYMTFVHRNMTRHTHQPCVRFVIEPCVRVVICRCKHVIKRHQHVWLNRVVYRRLQVPKAQRTKTLLPFQDSTQSNQYTHITKRRPSRPLLKLLKSFLTRSDKGVTNCVCLVIPSYWYQQKEHSKSFDLT